MKKPNKRPNDLSIEPTPVQVTVLLTTLPNKIIEKRVKVNIAIPKPTLLINSDQYIHLQLAEFFGTNIMVTTVDITHFIKEIKLKENL